MQVLNQLSNKGFKIIPVTFKQMFTRTFPENFVIPKEEHPEDDKLIEDNPVITKNRFDIAEMVRILLGEETSFVFNFFWIIGNFFLMISFCTQFSTSIISSIPLIEAETCDIYEDTTGFGDKCWVKY